MAIPTTINDTNGIDNDLVANTNIIKYSHNTYGRRTRNIPSEDALFYLRKRSRAAVSMTANDGACWVRAHTSVIDDGVTSIENDFDRGSSGLGEITFLIT